MVAVPPRAKASCVIGSVSSWKEKEKREILVVVGADDMPMVTFPRTKRKISDGKSFK